MALLQIQEPGQNKQNQASNDVIIGIDLGTTNSLVAIVENEKAKTLADENGHDILPSVVDYEGKKISSVKRLMGKDKNLLIDIGTRKIRPEEVSAEILRNLKNIAEKKLQKPIKKAVITVPAYFDEAAKNATKLAANLADLEVVRLVNEPTAAALAYGLDNSVEGIYCVYDLGGGTFDVSILKMQKGVFKVLGVSGDNNLGGDDFDTAIAKNFPQLSLEEARKAKEMLSKFMIYDLRFTIFKREDFEKLIADKIEKTITLTKNLLDDLELAAEEIKGIVLVGGSTQIPLIRKKLTEIFGEKKVLTNLDPDRVVAIGAAWQAHNLSGGRKNLLLDVSALSLGIEMMGGIVEKIIPRNSTIPIAITKEFTTYTDNQTGIKFHIVQGERELAKDCRSLGEFEIKNIPAMKAGLARIQVTFKLDTDGLLVVSAQEKITKQKQEVEIRPTYLLGQDEIKKMLLDSLKNSAKDIEERLLVETVTEANQDMIIIEKDLKGYDGKDKKLIEKKLKILQEAIISKTSRDSILLAQKELATAAENLILEKVNCVLDKKINGKKIDEVLS